MAPVTSYDIVGLGFGPANIALATAMADSAEAAGNASLPLNTLFVERQSASLWQAGMLFEGTDIQHHYLRDFATPRNPRSRFTFPYYLWEKGRLFMFGTLGVVYPSRLEYADYIQWVAGHFSDIVRYGTDVTGVRIADPRQDGAGFAVDIRRPDGSSETLLTRCVVCATGRVPAVPDVFAPHLGDRLFHTSEFVHRIDALDAKRPIRFAVVGGAQSAGEIIVYLLGRFPEAKIYSIIRTFGYHTVDLGHFLNEINFPEFVDYHYRLDRKGKEALLRDTWYTNYSVIDYDVSRALYWQRYEDFVRGRERFHLLRNSEVIRCDAAGDEFVLTINDRYTRSQTRLTADVVIVGAGYREEPVPGPLKSMLPYLETDGQGSPVVLRDYRVRCKPTVGGLLYLNGLTERSHGISNSTSFSMMAVKAGEVWESIARHLLGAASDRTGRAVAAAGREEP